MFSVQDFSEFSDHCPISFSLNCNVQLNENNSSNYVKYRWSDRLKHDFRSVLIAKLPCYNRLSNCIAISDRESINHTLCEFTNTCIVRGIADPLFKRHVFCKKSTQFIDNPINDKEWFDNDCSQAKQRYMEAQRV